MIGTESQFPLAGKSVLVAHYSAGPGAMLARELKKAGARVGILADGPLDCPDLEPITVSFSARKSVEQGFAEAERKLGKIDGVVHAAVPACAMTQRRLVGLDASEWQRACTAAIKATLFVLQASCTAFANREGAVVLAGPALGFTGGKHLVPLSCLLEAQRALAKSAARQLGQAGIRVNWTAMAAPVFSELLGGAALPAVPELGPPPLPLGYVPQCDDVAAVIAYLASTQSKMLTGVTINIDGGEWMLP